MSRAKLKKSKTCPKCGVNMQLDDRIVACPRCLKNGGTGCCNGGDPNAVCNECDDAQFGRLEQIHEALDSLIVALKQKSSDDYDNVGDFANMLINTDGYDIFESRLEDYWQNEAGRR
jgi:hypothetical protein